MEALISPLLKTLALPTDPPLRILLIEDSADDAELLRHALKPEPFEITRVDTLAGATKQLHERPFEVVLLDLSLIDSDGLESFTKIQPHAPNAAIIVLTGLDDEHLGLQTVQAGAQDFLVKGNLGRSMLARAIRHAVERKRADTVTNEYARALAARNAQMRDDLQLAREVQQAFLPKRCPTFPVGSVRPSLQFVHRYVPAGVVGGDFFDVFALTPDTAAVIVCDVMGHGVRAALVTAILRTLVGPHATYAADPSLMLSDLNQRLRSILSGGESVMFVTGVYLVVNALTGEIRVANAGHPKPLRISTEGEVTPLGVVDQPIGPPLGLIEQPSYHDHVVQLAQGDRLFLYTDGVYELEGAAGDSFGQARLRQALSNHVALDAEPFLETLLAQLRAYSSSGQFTDDACLIAMDYRRTATGEH